MNIGKQISASRRAIAILLLSLVCSLLVNNVAYLHTHITSEGIYISHAHPFNTSNDSVPIKKHTHKKFEYSVINAFSFFIIATTLCLAIIDSSISIKRIEDKLYFTQRTTEHNFLRGPPAIL